MKDIAVFGAGGFGREVACLIRLINESLEEPIWNMIGFFDDGVDKGTQISHFGICLGGVDELNQWGTPLDVCVAIGSGTTVEKVVNKISNPMVEFPNVIHPTFYRSDKETFTIGYGNIIQGACVASCDVNIGNFNVMNGYVVMGHDVCIGSFNTFMPGVRVSGEVSIGNNCFFGVQSVILQQIKMKDHVRLAAGSVLMTKPKSGFLYLGVPAKKTEL